MFHFIAHAGHDHANEAVQGASTTGNSIVGMVVFAIFTVLIVGIIITTLLVRHRTVKSPEVSDED